MYAIGIYVSKGKSTVAIFYNGELFVKPFTIDHSEEGMSKLLTKIENIDKQRVKIVMEATGIYHLPILSRLLELNFFVSVENPYLLKKYFDVSLRKVKTDKVDSIKIAKYCFERWHCLKKYTIKDEIYDDLLFLSRQYTQHISLKVKAKIQLRNLVEVTFPGFLNCFDLETQYLFMLDVYEQYSHPNLIRNKEENLFINEIIEIAKKRGHRIGMKIAIKLYQLANSTLYGRPYNPSTQIAVDNCVNALRTLECATGSILSQMHSLAKQLPEYDTVNKMSGVGKKILPRIIAEIGDIRKYKSAKSLIATAGIDVPSYQSGNYLAKSMKISKRGNKYLRKCGYEIMKSLKSFKPTKDTAVYDYILKKESEGKPLKVCKIAGLNKFLKIYYARVKELYKNE